MAATLLAAITGAFGTQTMPLGARLFLFGSVIAWNAVKWHGWHVLARRVALPGGMAGTMAIGAVLLNLLLPLELWLAYAALDVPRAPPFWPVYLIALVISLTLAVVLSVIQTNRSLAVSEEELPPPPSGATALRPLPAFLAAAGAVSTDDVIALMAEDHYVRIILKDGRQPLVHHRFGLAVADMADADGALVHRSAWVARRGIARSERDGRKWRIMLVDGTVVPVSAPNVPALRKAGYIGG